MLRLLGVKKNFPGRQIIDIPDLQIDPGFHWLRGPNGSGKTTLLRIIAGLTPFDGEVLLDGSSLKKEGVNYRGKTGWAEAEPLFPAFLTGQELVSLCGDIRKASRAQLSALIERFGMESCLPDPTGTYSSGMLKRLSLLMAFIGKPSLVLLDEPLLTLDTGIAGILPQLMSEYFLQNGTGFIYSSHQPFPLPGFPGEITWQMAHQTISAQ